MSTPDLKHSRHGEHDATRDDARLEPRDTWILLFVIAALVLVLCFTSPHLSDAAVLHATARP
jgi:hypothetical protein